MKSRTTSAVLTILFGPLGLFYTTALGAIVLLIVAIGTAPTVVGPVLTWAAAIFWGDYLARQSRQAAGGGALFDVRPQQAQQPESGAEPPQRPERKESRGKRIFGVSLVEMVIYAIVVGFVMFVLPELLGREGKETALHFYFEFFGLLD